MVVEAMAELVEVEVDLLTMFRVLVQDKATVVAAVKHLTKAEIPQTVTATHDLAATAELTQVVVVAMAARIMALADQESLS
jgi:ABC-type dipeptide/oligopeptide/nickel transport system ATPase component